MPRTASPSPDLPSLPALTSLPPVSRLLVALALTLAAWEDRRRTRRALARLDDHLIRDIGLSPALREAECLKPFWRD